MTMSESYKMEILGGITDDPVTINHIGTKWLVLCVGPHVEYAGHINRQVVELESVVGTYLREDSHKPMLQGIYGTVWESAEHIKAYLHFEEEDKWWDQRRIRQDLDLFSIQDEAGEGSTDVLLCEVVSRILGHADIVVDIRPLRSIGGNRRAISAMGTTPTVDSEIVSDSRVNPYQSGENVI
ncbi:threonine--tRNA ligase [Striga asiatica]|uniref:Threonine--tRNA ligase n=1 Tax=Striga asiatica TaxID=4170 RepID=A0A5A7RKN6_STRAF|nr:threonine--tRNA ligase [Striga asiatica]